MLPQLFEFEVPATTFMKELQDAATVIKPQHLQPEGL